MFVTFLRLSLKQPAHGSNLSLTYSQVSLPWSACEALTQGGTVGLVGETTWVVIEFDT